MRSSKNRSGFEKKLKDTSYHHNDHIVYDSPTWKVLGVYWFVPFVHTEYNYHLANIQEEKKTRDKAVKNLAIFLSDSQDEIPKPEMDKLWKGIFYSMLSPLQNHF